MDREKVIRAVDSCFNYWLDQHRCLLPLELEKVQQLKAGAIALLKEQEAVKIEVKELTNSGRGGRCPNCLMKLNETDYPNYCGYCGQKVKWG